MRLFCYSLHIIFPYHFPFNAGGVWKWRWDSYGVCNFTSRAVSILYSPLFNLNVFPRQVCSHRYSIWVDSLGKSVFIEGLDRYDATNLHHWQHPSRPQGRDKSEVSYFVHCRENNSPLYCGKDTSRLYCGQDNLHLYCREKFLRKL